MVAGETVKPFNTALVMDRTALTVVPALIVAVASCATALVLMLKDVLDCPAGTVTEDGGVALVGEGNRANGRGETFVRSLLLGGKLRTINELRRIRSGE